MGQEHTKMKIAYIDFDDIRNPLLGAGQALATYQVAKRMVAWGHEIKVYCSKYPGFKDRKEEGIQYIHVGLGSRFIRLNNLFYILIAPLIVRNIKVDIIVECFTAPISTLFSPLFTKIPVVALPTSFEAERFAKQYHMPFDKIENIGLRFYRYFLPTSLYFENKIRKVNKQVITKIVGQGVDKDCFTLKAKKPKHILFLGRLDIGQKGIDLLLKSYKKASEFIKYPLVIAGHGPDEKKIQDLINKNKLTKKVIMIGSTFGDKKRKYFSQALVSVTPSRHEGFGIAALESLAFGVPVISFDIPGLSWLPDSVSLKAKAFNTNEFAFQIVKSCKPDINAKLRKNCKKTAMKFTWDSVAEDYESFFHLILKKEKDNAKK